MFVSDKKLDAMLRKALMLRSNMPIELAGWKHVYGVKADGEGTVQLVDESNIVMATSTELPNGSFKYGCRADCFEVLPCLSDNVHDWSLVRDGHAVNGVNRHGEHVHVFDDGDWLYFITGANNYNPLKEDGSEWPINKEPDQKAKPEQKENPGAIGQSVDSGEPVGTGDDAGAKAGAAGQQEAGEQGDKEEGQADTDQSQGEGQPNSGEQDRWPGDPKPGDKQSSGGGGKPPPGPRVGEPVLATFRIGSTLHEDIPCTLIKETKQRRIIQRWDDGKFIKASRENIHLMPNKSVPYYNGEENIAPTPPAKKTIVSGCPDGYRFLAIGEDASSSGTLLDFDVSTGVVIQAQGRAWRPAGFIQAKPYPVGPPLCERPFSHYIIPVPKKDETNPDGSMFSLGGFDFIATWVPQIKEIAS